MDTLPPIHLHIHVDGLLELSTELRQGLRDLGIIITREGIRMSEASDALTAAVQNVQTGFATLNTTLQTEMQEIVAALSGASSDQALQAAAADAVARLGTLATSIGEMNTTIQNIIP